MKPAEQIADEIEQEVRRLLAEAEKMMTVVRVLRGMA